MPISTTVNDLLLDRIAISVRGVTGSFWSTSRKPYPLRSTTRPSWMIPRARPGTCHSVIWEATNWSTPDSARCVARSLGDDGAREDRRDQQGCEDTELHTQLHPIFGGGTILPATRAVRHHARNPLRHHLNPAPRRTSWRAC